MPTSARAGSVDSMGWLNGEMLYKYPISLSRSTYRGDSVGLRADVGIGPYIHVGVRSVYWNLRVRKIYCLEYET